MIVNEKTCREYIFKCLGDKIARSVFEKGDEHNSPCTRIQFKGGKWPDGEKNQGGMCEIALASCISKELQSLLA